MTRVSVVGCGHMGSALIQGLAIRGNYTVTACDVDEQALEAVSAYCESTTTDLDAAAESEVVFVVVKPDLAPAIVEDLDLSADQTLVSIAAGVSTDVLEPRTDATVVRLMPNLAASSGTMAGAVAGDEIGDEVTEIGDEVTEILDEVGVVVEIDESEMDVATALNGSGPAFVYYLIDAMAQAGVDGGLDPEDARVLAAQTFKGAAESVLRAEEDIEDMIDAVCTPGGTTIEGMNVLWDSDAAESVAAAVAAAEERSAELADESSDE